MEKSIFTDKKTIPVDTDCDKFYQETCLFWKEIRDYVFEKYPKAEEQWYYAGDKFGWAFRIKDKKRAIVYFLPVEPYFKLSFIFGERAFADILKSSVSLKIKEELENAKLYAEGRPLRVEINERGVLKDIKELIDIKLSH